MDHPRATIRRTVRLLGAVGLAIVTMSALAPVASARDSTYRISLTLRGNVDDDVGFGLGAGGTFFAPFCEFEALREETGSSAPLCRPDVTYTITLTAAEGEEFEYWISKVWLRTARDLWSETIVGDGRDHTRTYVYLFDLPATDTLPLLPGPVMRHARQPV
jgi:hypothetical protein